MTTTIERVRSDRNLALKVGNKAAATSLADLLAKIIAKGKDSNREPTEEEAIAVIKKEVDKNRETLSFAVGQWPQDKIDALDAETALFICYLPVQLTEEDLKALIYVRVNAGMKTKGELMKSLKSGYAGRYDGKIAASLIDSILKE